MQQGNYDYDRNRVISVRGRAEVTVNVDSTDAGGRRRRTTKRVPVDLFPAFTPPAPQTRAKDKTYRSGQ